MADHIYDLIIIGAGPAGYTAALRAAAMGMDAVLIEKKALGGSCVNTGCIPAKALLQATAVYRDMLKAFRFGIVAEKVSFDWRQMQIYKNESVESFRSMIQGMLEKAEVEMIHGDARLHADNVVRVTTSKGALTLKGKNVILATGSSPVIPDIPGIDLPQVMTSRDILRMDDWNFDCLTVIGGGVIGMEFASFFNSLGVQVTVVEMLDEILGGGMDRELAGMLRAEYAKRGIKFMLSAKVVSVMPDTAEASSLIQVNYETADGPGSVVAERLLMSVGRRPVMKGFGLENLGLERTERGNVFVNGQMQTSVPGVYACGDLTGYSLLAHTAVREAEVAIHSIIGKKDAMSYRAIPGVVYTNPEIAGVGETEESLQKRGVAYRAVKLPMTYSGRFVAENEGVNGVCKLLLGSDDTVLGAHVLGNPASEIITLAGMAIELKLTADEWKKIVFPHPTVGEIFKEAL